MGLLNQGLILDTKIFDLVPAFSQFDGNAVSLILDGLLLSEEDIAMDEYLLLSFLHAHLELVLLVLESIHMVGGLIQVFFDLLDLELHDVMLHQHFLFLLGDFVQILDGHVVLEGELLDLRVQLLLGGLDVDQPVVHCPQIVIEFLDTLIQDLVLFLHVPVLLCGLFDILLQVLLFLEGAFTLCAGYLPLHELDLILCVIEEFLLFLELLVELVDVGLQVAAGSHDALDFAIEGGFLLT
jgi:hypothetical protein